MNLREALSDGLIVLFLLIGGLAFVGMFFILMAWGAVTALVVFGIALVSAVPIGIGWTVGGLLSYRTHGWRHALWETYIRLVIICFGGAYGAYLLGFLPSDAGLPILLVFLAVLWITLSMAWVWERVKTWRGLESD